MNILDAIEEIRRKFPAGEPGANRDRGTHFEKLIKTYLKEDPRYKGLLADVWLWDEWPGRQEGDTGIDIVAKEQGGDLWAVQCKFYESENPLPKSGIDSFLATSGRYNFAQRCIFTTTDKWSSNAEKTLQGQSIPCRRVGIDQIADSAVEFTDIYGGGKVTQEKKKPRRHQEKAIADVINGFKQADRGKLIMACGTGKTFTSLKIAEAIVLQEGSSGNVLFLVPSISLLSQSLREWATEAHLPQRNFAVCSDSKVGKDDEGMRAYELAFPTTTNEKALAKKLKEHRESERINIIFSTYHSIDVVAGAQKLGAPEFDLIICDEAHRTTGVESADKEISYYSKVHNNDYLKAKRRLYMTATPRIYSDSAKTKAKEHDIEYFSMDDASVYGDEFHRLDFSDAVAKDLLSDYRVLVLAVNESDVSRSMQGQFAEDSELKLEDATKIIGCWNGLAKRIINRGEVTEVNTEPMRRAVAFTTTIKASEHITKMFSQVVEEYRATKSSYENPVLQCEFQHVDGTQNSLERDRKLNWLRQEPPESGGGGGDVCRVLSNARCLSEGVDVPALDAVMFLNPRRSVVDVVQSVGRVMRKAEGKQYGYIILPIGVPAGIPAHEALKDNKKYAVVWEVLQALRAHDNRFNATINQLELNKNRPDQIQIIGVGGEQEDEQDSKGDGEQTPAQLSLDIEEWRNAIYAKIVVKCGDRRYWETWAKDIADIANANTTRISGLLKSAHGDSQKRFSDFHNGLKANINPFISENEAIEMLSQHLITKPVFNALFKGYDFAAQNPVSQSMQGMIDLLDEQNLDSETDTLKRFYNSVRERAEGVDNAEGKQKIIIELYDKFFKTAFPKMAERLGIVYTPVEVIDFILQSVQDAMQTHFGKGLSDEGVDILDPFTGTGSFIVRMLQGDFIKEKDLRRKYQHEIHANEIVLLAYYIAAINIEEAYHFHVGGEYEPFQGILLADTFQLGEKKGETQNIFPENFARAEKQNQRNIRVIVGNPPYSAGQRSENDANQNIKYPILDQRIRETYAEHSTAANKNSLYDSYIRSIRWASDRIGDEGIIGYVSNGSYIDGNAAAGLRKCLADEFSAIYCFNLRGNIRKNMQNKNAGEGGNIFGQSSMTGIAITLFIKNAAVKNAKCKIYYHDIGDNLKQKDKIEKIKELVSAKNIRWQKITPNAEHDWINQRHPEFLKFLPIGDKSNKKKVNFISSAFSFYIGGLQTSRDAWIYNFSKQKVLSNMKFMIDCYNSQVSDYKKLSPNKKIKDFIEKNPTKISWSSSLINYFERGIIGVFSENKIKISMHRPFTKQHLYADTTFIHRPAILGILFPNTNTKNFLICIPNVGVEKDFFALMVDTVPDFSNITGVQCFPLYTYEKSNKDGVFDKNKHGNRTENIPDATLTMFRDHYNDPKISKQDIFYYVYGLLHSPHYKTKYAVDLKKMLPRIPMHTQFHVFSKAGKDLGQLHVNYEDAPEYPLREMSQNLVDATNRKVVKMKFAKDGTTTDKTAIIYNDQIILQDIPIRAYQYIVNGKSAIEWVMDRYQVAVHKDSQIKNDPNEWSEDPNYIIKLLKKVVYVSMESVKIIESLPKLDA